MADKNSYLKVKDILRGRLLLKDMTSLIKVVEHVFQVTNGYLLSCKSNLTTELGNVTFHFVCPDENISMICELQVSFECLQPLDKAMHFFYELVRAQSVEEVSKVISSLSN
jgi:hypothetical protein